jgi:hypothetical protein
MKDSQKFFVFKIFLCLIPINIYIIGNDFVGAGIQFPFFRFQVSYLGNSVILIIQEISYIYHGIISGASAISLLLWTVGSLLLLVSIIIPFINVQLVLNRNQKSGICILLAGILFLLSIVVQYGVYFSGPAGIAIPVGLPVLFLIGWWIYHEGHFDLFNEISNQDHGE